MAVSRNLYEVSWGAQVQCGFLGLGPESDLDLEEVLDPYFKQVTPLILMCGQVWEPRSSLFGSQSSEKAGSVI